jgi:hypothetical protein
MGEFLQSYEKDNPDEDVRMFQDALTEAVVAKQDGSVCLQCGQPIWAIGSAVVGWKGCFCCITGESDDSEDYEVDSVCL